MLNAMGSILGSAFGWTIGCLDYLFSLQKLLGKHRPKFYRLGYGDIDSCHESMQLTAEKLQAGTYDFHLTDDMIDWEKPKEEAYITIQKAHFESPRAKELPAASSNCEFFLVRPKEQKQDKNSEVYVIMLPATGEMGLGTRLKIARKLATAHGWNSIIVTAPYYRSRKPSNQSSFFLNSVRDTFLQGESLIEEASGLCAYLLRKSDEARVCFTGFSFGGAMSASATAFALCTGVDGKRVACASLAGAVSPDVLADGILESGICWDSLKKNKDETYEETRQRLFDELNLVHLGVVVPPPDKRAGVIKGIAMKNDAFVSPKHSRIFEFQVRNILQSTFELQWVPGGHLLAAVTRPFLHRNLIVETVQELLAI